MLEALRLLLKGEGFSVETTSSPAGVLSALEAKDFDAVLMDLNYARDTTSGEEGLDLLARIQRLDSMLPVVVMTAWGTVDLAVEAMRRGARDFVQKPWDNTRLTTTLRTQIALGRALRRGQRLEAENTILRQDAEPEMIAASARANRPFVTLNAGGISEGVFESELFGHVRGAFTDARSDRVGRFELADGGTLFLDEIANVPASQQAKLLRVLETGEFERLGSSRTRKVDVRMISATNSDIGAEVVAGRFRQDLLFRLNTIEIRIPPLREREEDIPALALHFLSRHARHYRKDVRRFAAAALQAMLDHPWPGNVRELDHAVERATLMARGDAIEARDLGLRPTGDGAPLLEQMSLEEVERILVQKAMARYAGNVSRAARALGLSRSALYRRLERL